MISPLAEAGIDKQGVRHLSRALGLPWWDKPAQPCLASRFPYGEPITAGRLQRVAAAETWLRQRGFTALRVRSQGKRPGLSCLPMPWRPPWSGWPGGRCANSWWRPSPIWASRRWPSIWRAW